MAVPEEWKSSSQCTSFHRLGDEQAALMARINPGCQQKLGVRIQRIAELLEFPPIQIRVVVTHALDRRERGEGWQI